MNASLMYVFNLMCLDVCVCASLYTIEHSNHVLLGISHTFVEPLISIYSGVCINHHASLDPVWMWM
jgi:hypothetical protein